MSSKATNGRLRARARRGWLHRGAALALLSVLGRGDLPAQGPDSVVVTPGAHYAARGLARALLGDGYRHLWTAPIRAPVLDLGRFAGGLEPLEPGGGHQTRTLHMQGADGKRYLFRSVDKFVEQVLPADLRRTVVHDVFQDHMSALHPSAALAVPPLLEAAGVLHVRPRLVVMPDDPRLGEFRAEFAGMLGQIEERPNEGDDGAAGFAGSERVVGTERLLERLEEDPAQAVAAEEYLAARLVDFLIGDPDRGSDQWRWTAEEDDDGVLWFRPVPRDRDWAFLRSDGWLSPVARMVFPKLVEFGPEYPSLAGLTFAPIDLDRQLLAPLPREAWDSVVAALQRAFTDDVIAAAVRSLPPEHRRLEGRRMEAALVARRDGVPGIARRFYELLAEDVDIRGTVVDDEVTVQVHPDGSVEVRGPGPTFHRRFRPGETDEVRIHLLDGADRALVRGTAATPIVIRVVGGGGGDTLIDSTTSNAVDVAFYDAAGANDIRAGPSTHVDPEPFEPPEPEGGWVAQKVTRRSFRDWGGSGSIRPALDYGEGAGVIIGARLERTRYGFRRVPYARRLWLEGQYALGSGGFGVEAGVRRTRENSPWSLSVGVSGRQFDALRFYGFGNETSVPDGGHGAALVMQDRLEARAALTRESGPLALGVGAEARRVDPRPDPGSPFDASGAPGSESYGAVGAFVEGALDRVTGGSTSPRGFALEARATTSPPIRDAADASGTATAGARAYLGSGPTLALRAGATKAWGDFPIEDAAFIGGKATLRGFRYQRFAGDAAVHGSAELRVPLTRILLLVRGDLGAFGFVDAGRVHLDGASPGGWHTGHGAGLSFTSLGTTVRLSWARGEEDRIYLGFGGRL